MRRNKIIEIKKKNQTKKRANRRLRIHGTSCRQS